MKNGRGLFSSGGKEEWRKIGRVEEEMEGTNGRRSW